MSIHPDLSEHYEAVFLPSLPPLHREAAQLLHRQIRRLDALRQATGTVRWNEELGEVSIEIREAYKIVLTLARETDRVSVGK